MKKRREFRHAALNVRFGRELVSASTTLIRQHNRFVTPSCFVVDDDQDEGDRHDYWENGGNLKTALRCRCELIFQVLLSIFLEQFLELTIVDGFVANTEEVLGLVDRLVLRFVRVRVVRELLVVVLDVGKQFRFLGCLLYTSPSPRDRQKSRMPSSA